MPERPREFTPELAASICQRLTEGESLLAMCDGEDMPAYWRVFEWLREREDFAKEYARAREIHADRAFEEIQRIADDGRNDWMERHGKDDAGWEANGEHIQRSKLRVDTLKWRLGRMAPKKYGDSTTISHTGADGGPIATVSLPADPVEAARIYQELVAGK